MQKSILIIGGGFGGVALARALAKQETKDMHIRIIDPKPYFEYHAALYRYVTGRSPMEVCIPYKDIFEGHDIECIQDTILSIDTIGRSATGKTGTQYSFDNAIIASGGEASYCNIPGLAQYGFALKHGSDALKLRKHLQGVFAQAKTATPAERSSLLHIVVIGGGASGVELAGELASFAQKLALQYHIDSREIQIDIAEGKDRLLPQLPDAVSKSAEQRLQALGVQVLLQQKLEHVAKEEISMSGKKTKTRTVIWTAGMSYNTLGEQNERMPTDEKGRCLVDGALRARGQQHIFVLGDLAATEYTGMAQTALYDGKFIAEVLQAESQSKPAPIYAPKKPSYAVPIGPGWAVVHINGRTFTGKIGWLLRRYADWKAFSSLLSFKKSIKAFRANTSENHQHW